uniref:Glutathione S-transferase unclassified n=1 Tax=Meteorus pulchricornis TaxID=51522 RepID=A0A4D6J8H7_9HYME|nr:glutathione S-transferase unclassified [Meteorus pulchricornis]
MFFAYERTPLGLKKMRMALDIFETYLKRTNSAYAAGDSLTIADFPLVTATLCLEAIDFSIAPWPLIEKWYNNFKLKHTELWEIAAGGLKELSFFEKNPPDLSHMVHPIHPIRKVSK